MYESLFDRRVLNSSVSADCLLLGMWLTLRRIFDCLLLGMWLTLRRIFDCLLLGMWLTLRRIFDCLLLGMWLTLRRIFDCLLLGMWLTLRRIFDCLLLGMWLTLRRIFDCLLLGMWLDAAKNIWLPFAWNVTDTRLWIGHHGADLNSDGAMFESWSRYWLILLTILKRPEPLVQGNSLMLSKTRTFGSVRLWLWTFYLNMIFCFDTCHSFLL